TKPTQHSVKELKSLGISPDMIILRTRKPITQAIKDKIALFCDVAQEDVIACQDVDILYQVMINLREEGLDRLACQHLSLDCKESNINFFIYLVDNIRQISESVRIGLVGKYVSLKDAYLSVVESLNHAGYYHKVDVEIEWIHSSEINEENVEEKLAGLDGILVPGGFGERGIDGKMLAIKYARENRVPFLGLCLGMQLSVIEFARNVCGLNGAHSTEFDPKTPYNVIDYMPDQYEGINYGGTLRLGLYGCEIKKDTLAQTTYLKDFIQERHRHRYEFNNEYLDLLSKNGMVFSGKNPETNLVEIVELKDHPYFIAVQFHPEFLSRPDKPHPLFKAFIKYSKDHQ
ncbi:MAG: CTP synthase, partial [Sphaerochaetaceae bacterium]|nr:CTP synthase [Sphaerochaetaceae bacterium]